MIAENTNFKKILDFLGLTRDFVNLTIDDDILRITLLFGFLIQILRNLVELEQNSKSSKKG